MGFLKKLFGKKSSNTVPETITSPNITLANLQQFDDVKVKINNDVFEGWVLDRIGNKVNIIYADNNKKLINVSFTLERPLDRTVLEQNNKTLILE